MTAISLTTRPAAPDPCCVPGTTAPLALDEAERLAALLKAVADPTRLRLLSLLAQAPDAERCICDLTAPVGLSQPTVSHHMKILVEAGLLTREQRSKWAYYRLVDGAADALTAALLAVVSAPGATTLTP